MPGFGRTHTDLSLDEQGDDGEDPDAADPRHGAFGHRAEMAQGGPAGVLLGGAGGVRFFAPRVLLQRLVMLQRDR